jgi:hypothetical protein
MTIDYLWLIVKNVRLNIAYFRNLCNLFCKSSWRLRNKSMAKYYEFFQNFSLPHRWVSLLLLCSGVKIFFSTAEALDFSMGFVCLIYPSQRGISDVLIHIYVLKLRCLFRVSQIQSHPAVGGEPFYSKKQHALILVFPRQFKVLFMVLLIS